eukprot:349862-Chlamydomonas_euryale.AAC.3
MGRLGLTGDQPHLDSTRSSVSPQHRALGRKWLSAVPAPCAWKEMGRLGLPEDKPHPCLTRSSVPPQHRAL